MSKRVKRIKPSILCSLLALLLVPACDAPVAEEGGETAAATTTAADDTATESSDDVQLVTVISAGPNAAKEAQEALILAEEGDVIEFGEGTFEFDGSLSLDGTDNITIRGQGIEQTILDFSKQKKGTGGEGIKIKSNNFLMEDLTIQNSPGDAIKANDSSMVTFRRVRTWWSSGPSTENGAYGFYPVMCKNVLIEHCVAECASDAGIYVGQTENTIVRYNRASRNVAGIEIENTIGADVYENVATGNTAGLLVFSLPGLTITNGRQARVYNNQVHDNNLANFAPEGNIVAGVPAGIGLMIMANNDVEIFENDVHDNKTTNCAIVAFSDTKKRKAPADFNRFAEGIHVHDNKFANGGTDPEGRLAKLYNSVEQGPLPDIVIDGLMNDEKMVDGKLPDELGICISNNGDATFVNLNMKTVADGGEPEFITDLSLYGGKLDALPAIKIPGVN
jgi:parallel beta-helix repeat protein